MRQQYVRGPSTLSKVFNQPPGSKLKLYWKDEDPVGPKGHPSLFKESIGVLMARARRYDWRKYWEKQDPESRDALWPEINVNISFMF